MADTIDRVREAMGRIAYLAERSDGLARDAYDDTLGLLTAAIEQGEEATAEDRQRAEVVAVRVAAPFQPASEVVETIAEALADERRRVLTEAREVVERETSAYPGASPAITSGIWGGFDQWAAARIDGR